MPELNLCPFCGSNATQRDLLKLLVDQARKASLKSAGDPQPGDLVVEVSKFVLDPDAIGWLIGTGEAAYAEDGTGPTRVVWDVVPLSGAKGRKTLYQRWENADFVKVQTRLSLEMPEGVRALIAEPAPSTAPSSPSPPSSAGRGQG